VDRSHSPIALIEGVLRQEWALLDDCLPWGEVLGEADRQRVAPLLYHRLAAGERWQRIPQPWAAHLLARFQESALRNALYLVSLEAALAALNREAIQPILLKGAALAYTLYPHPALRPMGDLDLWVQPAEFSRALEALRRAGWLPAFPGQEALLQAGVTHHLCLGNPGGFPRTLELHQRWMTLPGPLRAPDGEESVWQRASPVRIGGGQARILEPVDHFIYLAAHLARHAADEDLLIRYADLALLVERYGSGLDGKSVTSRAIQLGLAAPLAWVVPRLQQRMGAGISGFAQGQHPFTPFNPVTFALFAPPQADWEQVRVERAWYIWRNLPGWSQRLHWIAQLFLPSRDYLASLYPQDTARRRLLRYPQRWLHYGSRIGRLLIRRRGL